MTAVIYENCKLSLQSPTVLSILTMRDPHLASGPVVPAVPPTSQFTKAKTKRYIPRSMNAIKGLLFLYAVVLAGNINAVDVASKDRLRFDHPVGIFNRLLRSAGSKTLSDTTSAYTTYREDRGADGAWVSKLAEADNKVWKLRKLDMKLSEILWIKMGKDPKYLFNTFEQLHNTWAKIDSNKKTVQWFRFVKAFRAKKGTGRFPDYDIYSLLRTKVPEEKLAVVFESLKQIPDVKSLAETMQQYQFRLWIDRKETPASIGNLLGIRVALRTERGPKDDILSSFTKMYRGQAE
ncbi:unnamed protein product [Phytophthora fragariaefolia]|uniref:Unnamed protein product n=1 Tax=Phytophthora fragariaefolia TaxID=1490495 RepID=A0A9W6Y8S2_9STRA|nr:unnamed protein product [Phytophthora fragariaefolia]